jgi:hypothetical protein
VVDADEVWDMSTLLMMAAAITQVFNCELSPPRVVSLDEGTSKVELINGLPAAAMTFRMVLKGNSAEVVWKDSPINMQGKQVVLPTSPDSGVIMFLSGGPCLFTETACATMVNYAKQPDGGIKLILTPSAITTDKGRQVRIPFLVAIPGQCTAVKDRK